MPKPHTFQILVVQPPPSNPSAPSGLVLYLAACFRSDSNRIAFYDANLDDLQPPPSETRNTLNISQKIQDSGFPVASNAWKTLQSESAYQPDAFIAAVRALRELALNRRHPSPLSISFREGLSRRIAAARPHLVVVAAESSGQFTEGQKMRRWVKSVKKDLPVCLVCGPDVRRSDKPETEVMGIKDVLFLSQRFPGLAGIAVKPPEELPDLNLFPISRYAAPGIILDLNGFSGTRIQENCLWKDRHRAGIKGLLLSHSDSQALEKIFFKEKDAGPMPALGLRLPLAAIYSTKRFTDYFEKGVRLILWHPSGKHIQETGNTLFHASAAGIWNHLEIKNPQDPPDRLLNFAALNPNLVHSWGPLSPGDFSFNTTAVTPLPSAYDAAGPMHGTPFWRYLADPVFLLSYLTRYDARKLLRWRVRDDGSVYGLGEGITYHFTRPEALPPGHLDVICKMVEAGGAVDTRRVRNNLERAFLIAYAEEEGVIVGNSSLKHPREAYLKDLSRKTGFNLMGYLERGYTSVRPEYRGLGIGTRLLEGLTARIGNKKLFSIIEEDNVATQKMAIRNRTRKVGVFFSEKTKKTVGIWVPEWMLDS